MQDRIFLGALGGLYLALGISALTQPFTVAETVALKPVSPGGALEFTAVYGGLEISLGFWWILAAASPARVVNGLQLALLVHLGLACTRFVGLFQWPEADLWGWSGLALAGELLVVILVSILLAPMFRHPKDPGAQANPSPELDRNEPSAQNMRTD